MELGELERKRILIKQKREEWEENGEEGREEGGVFFFLE